MSLQGANEQHEAQMSRVDKMALSVTRKVGSFSFFLMILTWTILWCGYNLIASEFPSLHLVAFDPFPAYVAWLLISNVIQILLMPLILVGQTIEARHDGLRAAHDHDAVMATLSKIDEVLEQNAAMAIELAEIKKALPKPSAWL